MLNKYQQSGLYHVREAAKSLVPEMRGMASDRIPKDQPLVFYEGMIATCLAVNGVIMQSSIPKSIWSESKPSSIALTDSEIMVYALLWDLADMWEKKTGVKLKHHSLGDS